MRRENAHSHHKLRNTHSEFNYNGLLITVAHAVTAGAVRGQTKLRLNRRLHTLRLAVDS